MTQVLDYSAGFPGALAIVRAGYVGAVRYIGYPDRAKCTTANELQDFSRNGIGMALVFENNDTWWRRGYTGGQADARTARDHANSIGFPMGCPIYYAIDHQVTTLADLSLAVQYIQGAASVDGVTRVGVYGQYSVVRAVAQVGAAKYLWQCRAWSGSPIQYWPGRHLFQNVGTVNVGGVGCDINDVNAPDWGQHNLEDTVDWSDPLADPNHVAGSSSPSAYAAGDWLVQANLKAGRAEATAARIETKLDALAGSLSNDEANIIAAVRAQPTGGQVDVADLATRLSATLGPDMAAELGRRLNP